MACIGSDQTIKRPAVLVGVREFARIKGVTPGTVSVAIKRRLSDAVVMENGRPLIDVDRALALWDTRTQRNGREKVSPAAKARDRREVLPSAEQLRTVIDALPEDQIPGIDVSRERRAHYQAELSRLETLKLRGELLVADDVKKAAFDQGRMIRDNLLALPHQLAPQIAAMTDAREIHLLLTAEFSKALQMLPKE